MYQNPSWDNNTKNVNEQEYNLKWYIFMKKHRDIAFLILCGLSLITGEWNWKITEILSVLFVHCCLEIDCQIFHLGVQHPIFFKVIGVVMDLIGNTITTMLMLGKGGIFLSSWGLLMNFLRCTCYNSIIMQQCIKAPTLNNSDSPAEYHIYLWHWGSYELTSQGASF